MSDEYVVFADGSTLSPQEVMMVAKQRAIVSVSENAWPAIHAARGVVDRIVSTGETVYGINTGFGALVHERISAEDLALLQLNLVRSHATALGEYMSVEAVRAMMLIRLNSTIMCTPPYHESAVWERVGIWLHCLTLRWHSLGKEGSLKMEASDRRPMRCSKKDWWPLNSLQRTAYR